MKDFQVIKDAVDTDTITALCSEMDRVLSDHAPEQGRTTEAMRYRVEKYRTPDYPLVNDVVEPLVHRYLDPDQYRAGFVAYVRQVASNGLHADANPAQGEVYTLLLPIRHVDTTDTTVVFDHDTSSTKRMGHNEALLRAEMSYRDHPAQHRHKERLHLTHLRDWIDRMPLKGVFPYRLGDAVLFNAKLLHCSNDWKALNPQRQHKDYILAHVQHRDSETFQSTTK